MDGMDPMDGKDGAGALAGKPSFAQRASERRPPVAPAGLLKMTENPSAGLSLRTNKFVRSTR